MDVVATSSDIINSREREDRSCYTLKLYGLSPEVTYIFACIFQSFAALPAGNATITAAFDKLLHGSSSARDRVANKTDSDSASDGDGSGWSRAAARRKTRPGVALEKRVLEFAGKHFTTTRWTADSTRPALQMATTVQMRPWEHRYISCDVTNVESIGCTSDDPALETNATFVRLTTAIPALASPMAKWVVNQRCGFYTVNLFVREDRKDVVATLNTQLREALQIPSIALGISCYVVRRSRGRVFRDSQVRISLTPEVPRKPNPYQQRRVATASASTIAPTPSMDSWAGRVLDGVRRTAPTANLDHRPRKQPRSAAAVAEATAPSHSSAPTTPAPAVAFRQQQDVRQLASSASQARLTQPNNVGLSHSRSTQEPQLPPALAALRKMVEDSNKRIDSLLDIPRQVQVLSDRLSQMEMASTASTEIMGTMQTKMEQIAVSLTAVYNELRRLTASPAGVSAPPAVTVAATVPALPLSDTVMTSAPVSPQRARGTTHLGSQQRDTHGPGTAGMSSASASPAHNGGATRHG